MNSERRHELQQNTLADFLGRQLKKIEPYTKLIAVVIAVAVFGAVAWGLYRSAAVGARSDATLELLQNAGIGDPEALGLVGDRYSDTTAGVLAKLYQADVLLAEGIAALFNDREEAQTQLAEALRRYGEVAQANTDTLISSRANLGLARTHESMGQVDKAISAYERVVSIGESEAIVRSAQQRIAQLKHPETEEFLVWFERQDFTPADPAMPPTMPGGGSLPDFPDLDLPDVSPLNVPDELRGAPAEGDAPGELDLPPTDPASEPADATSPADTTPPAVDPVAPASEPADPTVGDPAAGPEPADTDRPVESAAEPVTEPADAPVTDPAADPIDQSAAEPADPQPTVDPNTDPAAEAEPRQ